MACALGGHIARSIGRSMHILLHPSGARYESDVPNLVLFSVPAFLALMALEMAIAAHRGLDMYERRDTLASLGMGVANVIVNGACKAGTLGFHYWLWRRRLFDVGTGWVA